MIRRNRRAILAVVIAMILFNWIEEQVLATDSVIDRQGEITAVPSLSELLNPPKQTADEVEDLVFRNIKVCSSSAAKTYMDWTKISPTSRQGRFIAENMTIRDGLLYDRDGFIGVALGSYFGKIGDRFIFTLGTGIELRLIKVEEKSDRHTVKGCQQRWDKSVIEFLVDMKTENFPRYSNSHPANGNFNNLPQFKGEIVCIKKEIQN